MPTGWCTPATTSIAPAEFEGVYTSHDMPHLISNMPYAYDGNPALGRAIAETAGQHGLVARATEHEGVSLEYGTLMPMRYMNADGHFRVVSCAAWCAQHRLQDSRQFGALVRRAIEASDSIVMLLASGSMSHHFQDSNNAYAGRFSITREFDYQVDMRVLELWRSGQWKAFCAMLPDYAQACHGEGGMHDTAMLLGALGWDEYRPRSGDRDRLLRRVGHRAGERRVSGELTARRMPTRRRLTGAVEKTRTSTGFPPQAPQACASTIPPRPHRGRGAGI